jgi:hypothetical protein
MPGLLRGMARTAVIAGTATAVSNNVSRRQAARWNSQEDASQAQYEQQAPAPAQGSNDDVYTELQKLGQLKADGILTQDEFDAKKRQLLGL